MTAVDAAQLAVSGDGSVPLLSGDYSVAADVAYIDQLRRAKNEGEASFEQTFLALYLASSPTYKDLAPELRALHPDLLKAFETTHGSIETTRYGHSAAAGAVLTRADDETARRLVARSSWPSLRSYRRGSVEPSASDEQGLLDRMPRAIGFEAFVWWQWLNFDVQEANELLAAILRLRDRVAMFLPLTWRSAPVARDIALRQLFGIASELLQSLDDEEARTESEPETNAVVSTKPVDAAPDPPPAEPATPDDSEAAARAAAWREEQQWRTRHKDQRPSERHLRTINRLHKRLEDTTAVYLASAQRLAQREYVAGMFMGMLFAVAPALAVLGAATAILDFSGVWIATATAGATGAVLSVLQRMSRGPLEINPEGERRTFRLLGVVRPVIGFALGVASYVLVGGGLIALSTPQGAGNHILYFAGIAFLAGFSERFAQDMLTTQPVVNKRTTAVQPS